MASPAIDSMALFGILAAAIGSLLGLAVCVFGGGALLMVGGRFIAKTPKATYWRSVGTITLAGLVSGMILTLALVLSFALLGPMGFVGTLAGAAAGLLATWLIIKAMFAVSFGKAILAWLPTLAMAVIVLPIGAMLTAMIAPAVTAARARANSVLCMNNLGIIGSAVMVYKAQNADKWPADITSMPAEYVGSTEVFVCPCMHGSRPAGRSCDYFYFPPTSNAALRILLACDFGGNHPDGSRNVLFSTGSVIKMTAAAFQAELADPANAAFAAALRQAEGEAEGSGNSASR